MKILPFRMLMVFCLLHGFVSFAQLKPTFVTHFNASYFYKLDSRRAFDVFNHNGKSPDSSIFTSPAYILSDISDSLPLKTGNYVKIKFNDNILSYEYIPITPWRLYILQNGDNLIIQLLDLKTAKPISVSNILYGKTKLVFDAKTQTYVLPHFQQNAHLSITDKGETFYYKIDRSRPAVKALIAKINQILSLSPTYYGANLYRLYNRCLIDGIGLIKEDRYYYGSCFNQTKQAFKGLWYRLKDPKREKEYRSYFYFSKPKFKEHDTIKFKAHILEDYKKGTWYDKPVLVFLDERNDGIYLGKAYSKRKGAGYDFQFVINDTMDIDLDNNYDITLKDLDSNKLGSDKFTYEDYELKKAVFSIDLANGKKQIKGKPFSIHFTAKDDNGLPMPDTRVAITAISERVYNVQPDRLFVPDTLWSFNTAIKNGEDTILIPDTIFPSANVDYSLEVAMQNSENERTDLSEKVEYHLDYNELKMELEDDGIHIYQTNSNKEKVMIKAKDRFGFNIVDTTVSSPCILPLNTHAETYDAETDDDDARLEMDNISPEASVNANRTKDSVFFSITNPRRLSVVYYLYDGTKQVKSGTQSDFPFGIPADDKKAYYLKAEYIWAGRTAIENTAVPLFKNTIHFNIEKPAVITPGKEVDIHITATDYKNNPVKDLNILAYAYTQKFGEMDVTTLPYANYISQNNNKYNVFDFNFENDNQRTALNYPFWNQKMMLDTDWAYTFRYPGPYKTTFTHIPVDDSITQIAPFVMDHGEPQAIQYVYIDNIPVYLGFTDKKMNYSFDVDTSYHQITIRTYKKLITIDSLKVKPYVKSLFSIDQNNLNVAIKVESMPDTFTMQERYKLSMCIMSLDMPASGLKYAYLERAQDNGQFIDLSQNDYNYSYMPKTIGPVYWRYWNFNTYEGMHRSFEYEPEYTYTFASDLVKMKSNIALNLVPTRLTNFVPDLNDEVLTKDMLLHKFEEAVFAERRSTTPIIDKPTPNGNCNLTIEYDTALYSFKPLNIIVGKPNDFNFINIYQGSCTHFNNLAPGQYQLLLIDKYNSYRQTDIIDVKENGSNFYRITKADTVKQTSFKAINDALLRLYLPKNQDKNIDVSVVMNSYVKNTFTGKTKGYAGKVIDPDGSGIPGAAIKIAGTSIGTMTDVDGRFEIDIPLNVEPLLKVNALGYGEQTIKATQNMVITMSESENVLNEVVVTQAYGPAITKNKYTGSADVITSRQIEKMPVSDITGAIEGAAPGVQVANASGTPGSAASIMIRGAGSLGSGTSPLYVIDGAIYNGDPTGLDPALIASVTLLKDATATSLYGSRGSNGVIVITTKKGAVLPDKIKAGLESAPPPMTDDMLVSSLRNNFRDDAYWQPDLVTDAQGKVSFKV